MKITLRWEFYKANQVKAERGGKKGGWAGDAAQDWTNMWKKLISWYVPRSLLEKRKKNFFFYIFSLFFLLFSPHLSLRSFSFSFSNYFLFLRDLFASFELFLKVAKVFNLKNPNRSENSLNIEWKSWSRRRIATWF